ncbi:MAG: hypothetical protein AAF617_14780, partial [Bacteroidota bacterium]
PVYNRLHIYIGKATSCEAAGGISFYGVPSVCDYENTIATEYRNYKTEYGIGAKSETELINSKLVPINFTTKAFNYSSKGQPAAAQLLIESIQNWNNSTTRNKWLASKFPKGTGSVLAAFDIDVSDFEPSHEHECYLALKPVPESVGSYVLDLVIVNTDTNAFLNIKEENGAVSFRDLSRLVPPFGQEGLPSTNASNFGIFSIAQNT